MVKTRESFAGFLVLLLLGICAQAQNLTQAEVQTIIAQAVSQARALNLNVSVSVVDEEANLLGTFVMTGTPAMTRVGLLGGRTGGLENALVPSTAASHSKAGTAGLLSSGGNAFTTRTAGFIIQEHFPPGIDFRPGGPLFGVQFSSIACSDVAIAGVPLGLSADPGGIPLYKNGVIVGGIGVEGDGRYTADPNPADDDVTAEEIIAVAATRGFEAPRLIRADNILVEGIRFPFANVEMPGQATQIPFATVLGMGTVSAPIIGPPPSDFVPSTLNGVNGQRSLRFPTVAGTSLTVAEVETILGNAAFTANRTRAGIRQPLGSNARVNISVIDITGRVLGFFRQLDAPVFGFDVSAQKGRSVNFISRADAGAKLTAAGVGSYVMRAAADGLPLNGSIAFSDRGFGFVHRPLFPDGINDTEAGPFSSRIENFSPFNNGLQLDLLLAPGGAFNPPPVCTSSGRAKSKMGPACRCTSIPELRNGLQIFAGGIPIYRGSTLIGAIGISGDGIDQDDLIAAGGANIFAPPAEMRSDRVFVRGVRLPFIKIPARPFLD